MAGQALVGLGSNLGDRRAHLSDGLRRLEAVPGVTVERVSAFVETRPWGVADQPDFLNAAASLRTTLEPEPLLAELLRIEAACGRERGRRWGPRTLDLDLLFFDDRVLSSADLVLPHPRLHCRGFVLEPLAQVAPDFRHPVLGRTVEELRADLRSGRAASWRNEP